MSEHATAEERMDDVADARVQPDPQLEPGRVAEPGPEPGPEPPPDPAGGISSPDVLAALAHLPELERVPVAEHVVVYESVHGGLIHALADLDDD